MVFDRSKWWYEQKETSNNHWEYIPGMSETRLNQINDELKAQGFKCPEIRYELDYRNKSKINNIVLDINDMDKDMDKNKVNKIVNHTDDIIGAYANDDALADDIYSYPDINVYRDSDNNETDFNPICLELDSRFEFNKK